MTPKTRIPKAVRHEVFAALTCFRDYLAAIDNKAGANGICDVAKVLGLGELPESNRFTNGYWNPGLHAMLKNREKYGPG